MILLLLSACKVIDAPQNIEDLMIFGFIHAHESDPEWAQAFAENLLPEMEAHAVALEDGYRVGTLCPADIDAAGFESDSDVNILGVATRTHLNSSLEDVLWALTFPDTTQIFSATKEFDLVEHTDRDCFLSKDCEFYDYRAHRVLDLSILGTAEQEVIGTMRHTTLESGQEAALWRGASPEEAKASLAVLHQQYAMELLTPDPDGGTWRVTAIWIDAEFVGIDLPDSFMVSTSVSQLKNAAEDIDAFIAENR